MARVLPRRLPPVLPTTYSPSFFHSAKALLFLTREHPESPCRACAHCKGFAPAAPRRAWTHVSESISGLPLSWPVPIIGLVGRYPTNNLIGHSPILRFSDRLFPEHLSYPPLSSVSRDYGGPEGRLTMYY